MPTDPLQNPTPTSALPADLTTRGPAERDGLGDHPTVSRPGDPHSTTAGPAPDAAQPHGPPAPPGYEVLGVLGRGGMGAVYKGRQVAVNRFVALKVVLAGAHATPEAQLRFLHEAEAAARVHHPNVVQVYEVGTWGGQPFLALEYMAGGTLARKLAGTPVSPREAAGLVETLARAVHAAHASGVIHRDLKPANVLLAEDGTPKVADFGLAKLTESGPGLTATGAVFGTPSYAAPEQARGDTRHIGPPADVYALGAILYECLTGRPPFKAASSSETFLQVLTEDPAAVRSVNAAVPADLETVCLKCLEKDAGRRYASAAGLADDLAAFRAGRPVTARPVGRLTQAWRWQRRNRPLAAALAVAAVVLVAGAATSTAFALAAARSARRADDDAARAREAAAAAMAAVAERDAAVRRQQDIVRAFMKAIEGYVKLDDGQKREVVARFLRDYPEFAPREVRAALAGTMPAATFNPNMFGD
jgi:serine/threonine-protein kinase